MTGRVGCLFVVAREFVQLRCVFLGLAGHGNLKVQWGGVAVYVISTVLVRRVC